MRPTLPEVLERLRTADGGDYVFVKDDGRESIHSYAGLARAACARGAALAALGAARGDRVALVLVDGEEFVLCFLGAIAVGLVPVPMYPPVGLGAVEAYGRTARAILERSSARWVIATASLVEPLRALGAGLPELRATVASDALPAGGAGPERIEPPDPEAECFLQFTSGSTAAPKGVIVSHRNVAANTHAIRDALGFDGARDRGVSWLPMYHDMGLIGKVLAPLVAPAPMSFQSTISFLKRPRSWLDRVSRLRATITFAPNFALDLLVRRATPAYVASLDLSSLRVLGCGAEPIRPETWRCFLEAYAPAGLAAEAFVPAYGIAEATLAVTFSGPGRRPRIERISRTAYEESHRAIPSDAADAIELVGCGKPLPGIEVEIVDEHGRTLGDGVVGEVVVRAESVTRGYASDPAASAAAIRAGRLHTGDLGFLLGGELFPCGREKDLIIRHGRNFDPHAIEWAVGEVEGVRAGSVAAFAAAGSEGERAVVVVESRAGDASRDLERRIRGAIAAELGLVVDEVVIVAPHTLPKTSSGKLQRRRVRQAYESRRLGDEAAGSEERS